MANEKRLDLIDRKALRDALYELDAITMKGVALINQFPAVHAVEVVHGRWLTWGEKFTKTVLIGVESLGVFCSVCDLHNDYMSNYCPNCGAKMDGERKDND